MAKDPQFDRRLRGGAAGWDILQAGPILEKDYFPAPPPANTVYRGLSWTNRYKGVRSDSALYLGAGVLR